MCVNNLPKVVAWQQNGRELNSRPLESQANALTITPPDHTQVLKPTHIETKSIQTDKSQVSARRKGGFMWSYYARRHYWSQNWINWSTQDIETVAKPKSYLERPFIVQSHASGQTLEAYLLPQEDGLNIPLCTLVRNCFR